MRAGEGREGGRGRGEEASGVDDSGQQAQADLRMKSGAGRGGEGREGTYGGNLSKPSGLPLPELLLLPARPGELALELVQPGEQLGRLELIVGRAGLELAPGGRERAREVAVEPVGLGQGVMEASERRGG